MTLYHGKKLCKALTESAVAESVNMLCNEHFTHTHILIHAHTLFCGTKFELTDVINVNMELLFSLNAKGNQLLLTAYMSGGNEGGKYH